MDWFFFAIAACLLYGLQGLFFREAGAKKVSEFHFSVLLSPDKLFYIPLLLFVI